MHDIASAENMMKRWTPTFALAALALTGATLCCAQTAPTNSAASAPRGAAYDCSGQIGDALVACRALNGLPKEPAAVAPIEPSKSVSPLRRPRRRPGAV